MHAAGIRPADFLSPMGNPMRMHLQADGQHYLAFHFVLRLHAVLTPAQLTEVRRRNAYRASIGDTLSCATHDFVDANEVMAAAFVVAFDRTPDLNDDDDLTLWNAAWSLAKAEKFRRPSLSVILKHYQFKLWHTGGNCTAWVRTVGTVYGARGKVDTREVLTVPEDPTAPTRMTDRVAVTVWEDDPDGDNDERLVSEMVIDAERLVKLVTHNRSNYYGTLLVDRERSYDADVAAGAI